MNIAVFFTYDYTLKTLSDAGILERELKIYDLINKKYKVNFVFYTYDENISLKYENKNFKFIPIYSFIKKRNNKVLRLIYSFLIPFKLKKDIKNHQINILHQHQILGSWIPIVLKKLTKLPLLTRTGYDAYQFSQKNNDSFYKKIFYKTLTSFSLKYSDLYTVTSRSDYKFLNSNFKNTKFLKVIPNWIEEIEIKDKTYYKDRILMVGRLEAQKNYELLIDLLKNSKKNLQVDIYGSGSLKEKLENDFKINKLNINILGNVSHDELKEIYMKYNYFLNTSLYEGNPKAVLEALNYQLIVFASNIPNHSEIIENNYNGVLFNSVEDLIVSIENIFENIELQNKIKKNISKKMEKNYIQNISELMYLDYKYLYELK